MMFFGGAFLFLLFVDGLFVIKMKIKPMKTKDDIMRTFLNLIKMDLFVFYRIANFFLR